MLDAQLEFYLNEREQSKWYGFWDYGDIRHAYDEIRHSGDERIGDIMDDERDADFSLARLDPLRAYFTPDPRYSAHIRWGPDIIALCEIWLTRWERYADTVYRDKILKMLDHFRKPGDFAASSIWVK
jgi:hypothetical protein